MTDAKRIVQLDGLRAIAVLMVFCSHAFGIRLLWAGVDLFFVLSGFLITGVLLEQRRHKTWIGYLALFYQRRIRRILPPYLLFLGLTSILFGIGWLRHWYLFVFLMNTAPFRDLAYRYSLVVLWSLAVEEQFYILWPFAVYALSETALAWLAGGLVLAAPLLRWSATVFFPEHWPIHTSTPFRMDLLAIGALIALAWRHHRAVVERFSAYGLLIAGFSACCLLLFSRYPSFQAGANNLFSECLALRAQSFWMCRCGVLGVGWPKGRSAQTKTASVPRKNKLQLLSGTLHCNFGRAAPSESFPARTSDSLRSLFYLCVAFVASCGAAHAVWCSSIST